MLPQQKAVSGDSLPESSSSATFDRLSRPGSGRGEQQQTSQYNAWDRGQRPGSGRGDSRHNSGSNPSLSPTSPSGGGHSGNIGLVPEHRIRAVATPPCSLPIVPGGGRIPSTTLTSPVQVEKRESLKMSFSHSQSQPNMRKLQFSSFQKKPVVFPFCTTVQSTGKLKIHGSEHDFKAEDLEDEGEIGRGAFGSVNKMVFQKTGSIMAVKRIRSTVDDKEQKQLLMDLEVVMKSNDCPYIVLFYGAIFKEGDCWICMELMDVSLDKFYKHIYEVDKLHIPETILGQITLAVVKALNYLKEHLKIIHRDVKPSNILLDRQGNIKLCDFGISGQLVDSIAKTRDAGCRPYMAPERIDPQRASTYDVRSDVWSLGITLIEVSTGKFPYPKWNSVFEQLQHVVKGEPPCLKQQYPELGGIQFTLDFVDFVNTCLSKEENKRPKYVVLLNHDFIKRAEFETPRVHVDDYVAQVLDRWDTEAMERMDVDMMSTSSTFQ